jgi:hypothetical protein
MSGPNSPHFPFHRFPPKFVGSSLQQWPTRTNFNHGVQEAAATATTAVGTMKPTMVTHGSVGGGSGYNANGGGSNRYGRGKIQQSTKRGSGRNGGGCGYGGDEDDCNGGSNGGGNGDGDRRRRIMEE